jgi:hypothetical protein
MTGRMHLPAQFLSLMNSEKVKAPEIVANAINTFFLTGSANLNLH